eukprot:tig00021108_g18380.t1
MDFGPNLPPARDVIEARATSRLPNHRPHRRASPARGLEGDRRDAAHEGRLVARGDAGQGRMGPNRDDRWAGVEAAVVADLLRATAPEERGPARIIFFGDAGFPRYASSYPDRIEPWLLQAAVDFAADPRRRPLSIVFHTLSLRKASWFDELRVGLEFNGVQIVRHNCL